MVETPGAIPSINESFINPDGNKITRTWYRVLQALTKNSGQLSQPITVKSNSFFVSGDINSGGTLEPVTIPSGELLGNSSGTAAAASPQTVDPSLSLSGGVLALAKLPGGAVLGNAGNVAAIPSELLIGAGLTIVAGSPPILEVSSGGPSNTTALAQTLSWWRQ